MNQETIDKINKLITDYFNNSTEDWIPAKEIMPTLIQGGIFSKDEKKGMPFRKVLRALDKEDQLSKIPSVHAERQEESIYWYLVKEGATYVPKDAEDIAKKAEKNKNKVTRERSDEYYLIHLCNDILDQKAFHQFTFEDLVGDEHKKNRKTTAIPLDAYYPELNLVLEFLEEEREPSANPKKIERLTVSGVTRAEQRKIYQKRKQIYLKENQIFLTEIRYSLFEQDERKNLLRNREEDILILKNILKKHIK